MLVWWEWLSFTGWLGVVISVAMRPTIHIALSEENFWAFQDTRLPLHYDYSWKLLRGRLSLDLDSRLVSFIVGWLVGLVLGIRPRALGMPGRTSVSTSEPRPQPWAHLFTLSMHSIPLNSPQTEDFYFGSLQSILGVTLNSKKGETCHEIVCSWIYSKGPPFLASRAGLYDIWKAFSIKSNFLFQDVLERELGSCHPLWLRGLWAVKTTNQKKKSWKHLRLFQTICFWPEPTSGILPNSRTGR